MKKMASRSDFPIVFLVGHRKAGTTLILNLFDSHPELCVYPVDLNILYNYYPEFAKEDIPRNQSEDRLKKVVAEYLQSILKKKNIYDEFKLDCFWDRFKDKIRNIPLNDIGAILEMLLDSFYECQTSNNSANKFFMAKETSIEIDAPTLRQWFPQAKFIHLIRDPRDNYAALRSGVVKHYKKFGDDDDSILSSMIHRLGLGMKLAEINQKVVGEENYHILKFEDLVSNCAGSMRELSKFIGITYDDCMLKPTVMGCMTRGNNFDNTDFTKVSDVNSGRWRERITADQAKIIEFNFKDIMKRYGYSLEYSYEESAEASRNFYHVVNKKYYYFDRYNTGVESLSKS